MYNEEYENRGFPFKNFLLKLILIIIFVFLLVWLLPKFIAPVISKNLEKNNTVNNSKISAIASQIFYDNLERMKDAAISYYTNERLPEEVGTSTKMTLSDMIGKKIITPLVDKNNNAVDVEGSYVKITKTEDEYILKVNLKDSETEDYILVHLGCYDYCDAYICEKKTDVKNNSSKPTASVPIKDGKEPVTPQPDPTPQPTPQPEPIPIPDPDPEPAEKEYLYEYAKTTGATFSKWSLWSDWSKTSCDTEEISCDDSDPKCRLQLKRYDRKEKIGTYEKEYVATSAKQVQVSSYEQKTCSAWEYVIINTKTYAVSRTYTTVYTVKPSSPGNLEGWNYIGRDIYTNPPRSENGTYYAFVGADFSYCHDTCSSGPTFVYDEYKYTGSMVEVDSTTKPVSTSTSVTATCGEIVTKTVPVYRTINVSDIATRTEPLYGTVCYKSTRTRELLEAGNTVKQWSTHNDTSLLNNGWYYTGATKLK